MRTFLRLLAWLIGIGVFATVALIVGTVVLYRRHATRRDAQIRAEQERIRAEVYGLAYIDPAGRCGWCGGVHTQHPAVFHAVSVVERVQEKLAA